MFDRPKLEHAPVSDPAAPRKKVSREGLVLIKSFEGFQPRAWRRPDGRWAIGYGHTRSAREGLTVSEADAELLLQYDLLPVVGALNDRVSRPLNQHQFDALASFALSVGLDAFLASDVLAALNAEGPEGAARALGARSEVDPALARAGRRRHAERALFEADPAAPVALATLLAAPAPDAPVATAPGGAPEIAPEPAPEAAPEPAPEPASEAAAAGSSEAPAAEAGSPVAPAMPEPAPAPAPPAFSLRYAAAVSHLLGEPPARPAPTEPDAAPPVAPPPPEAPGVAGPDDASADATPPEAEAPSPADSDPAAAAPLPPEPAAPATPSVSAAPDRRALMAELMRRQMSPFSVNVTGPLPVAAAAPAPAPAAPAPSQPASTATPALRSLAAMGPMAALVAGPLLLPEASPDAGTRPDGEAPTETPATEEDGPAPAPTPPLIEMEATPAGTAEPLVLTPPEPFDPPVQRPVWSAEERNPQARTLETDLFSEEELAADIGLGPVLRHEVVETPARRFEVGELGAYAGMGAVGLVSLGASVPALQALLDQGAGRSGETLLVFLALVLIGAGCGGIAGFNLWRLWREAHPREEPPRDA
jgi:lysozyme